MRLSKQRLVILSFLALLVISIAALIVQKSVQKPGNVAEIKYKGELVAVLDLSRNTELRLGGNDRDYNCIKVENGCIQVTSADCPDKICVSVGQISRSGEIIACVPHRLVISVKAR